MAHIVNCMLNGNVQNTTFSLHPHIEKAITPQSSNDSLVEKGSPSTTGTEKPFAWRMLQPERKYQLFPKGNPTASTGKGLDPEQAFAHAMSQNTGENSEKVLNSNGLRIRIKENTLVRRRKISVPDLGPMTTVQEVAMDSPTIPGRPPLHERSISAPGPSWKRSRQAGDSTPLSKGQTVDEWAELDASLQMDEDQVLPVIESRQPLSPKTLTPLVIPNRMSMVPRLINIKDQSLSRLRSGSTPAEPTSRFVRNDDTPSTTRTPFTPFTPYSASTTLTTPKSALSQMAASTLPTPVSAPVESRSSPKPWDRPCVLKSRSGMPADGKSDTQQLTIKTETQSGPGYASSHRRNQSDTGSIMERGRPRKRSETTGVAIVKRTPSKRSKSAERRAFEQLPKGWKAGDAMKILEPSEAAALQKQALQQASRFEVLRKDDVDNLARELRNLDERTEYLRRTYTSLRAGRRNLHTRICQYLRSPRTAKFSHDSMLKQEEALAELDASIDDWVTKLDQAENRRTRVRQKLLEHVAAAATLPIPPPPMVGVSESLQMAMGMRPPNMNGVGNLSTPPRSPTKPVFIASHNQSSSPSPQRVVAQVPSTIIEHPEDVATIGLALGIEPVEATATSNRRAETIHIFADNDVYALLADVENQITQMSGDISASASKEAALSEDERRELHRARSQDLLIHRQAPPVPVKREISSPPAEVSPPKEELIFLTSAVFKPFKP